MKRVYKRPSFVEVQIGTSDILCYSYGTAPIGGQTHELDAPKVRRGWDEYEAVDH